MCGVARQNKKDVNRRAHMRRIYVTCAPIELGEKGCTAYVYEIYNSVTLISYVSSLKDFIPFAFLQRLRFRRNGGLPQKLRW